MSSTHQEKEGEGNNVGGHQHPHQHPQQQHHQQQQHQHLLHHQHLEERQPASAVAHAFVEKYYTILREKIDQLYKFYDQEADCTRRQNENEKTSDITLCGVENIKDALVRHNTARGRVALSSVDYQSSVKDGVLLTVIGSVFIHEDATQSTDGEAEIEKRFVQTFFLVPEGPDNPNTYYVRNDIFTYLPLENGSGPSVSLIEPEIAPAESTVDQSPEVDSEPEEEHEKLDTIESPKEEETAPAQGVDQIDKEDSNDQQTPEQQKHEEDTSSPTPPKTEQKQKVQNQPKSSNIKQREVQVEPKPQPVPKKPSSWAGVVAFAPDDTTVVPQTQPIASSQPAKQTTTKAPKQQQEKQQTQKVAPKGGGDITVDCSVYVSNLPYNTTQEAIRELFYPYGKVKTIILKQQQGYCFIEFENQGVVKKLMNATKPPNEPLKLDNRKLTIEERRPERRRVNRDRKETGGPRKPPRSRNNDSRQLQRNRGGSGTH